MAEQTLTGQQTVSTPDFASSGLRKKTRRWKNHAAHVLFLLAALFGLVVLMILLADIIHRGWAWLTPDFFDNYASRFPSRSGIKAALWGSVTVMTVTAPLTFVLGVSTAVYLEEYAGKGWLSSLIRINISNLAGVPSIVFGMLGLTLFVRGMELGRSVLAGALTLTLLVLPVVIVAAGEAIAGVPDMLRHAAYALGATRWQAICRVVLPYAFPGILTGTILALSRALGETAPLIMIGTATYLAFTPSSLMDEFTVLPLQIYNWIAQPKEEFRFLAAAGIIVMLGLLLSMNAFAIWIRNKYRR
ncbi:phosphate ABC transporter permease PstA [Staphylospora marina]|uniref:phosphate ABC transporter permease PstA n=1 Tax=Staphylospora marina TaxID=2490858 RepID=UPI000F5BD958